MDVFLSINDLLIAAKNFADDWLLWTGLLHPHAKMYLYIYSLILGESAEMGMVGAVNDEVGV
jgi:hypothetical protein